MILNLLTTYWAAVAVGAILIQHLRTTTRHSRTETSDKKDR
jgi:hypothetical protein